MSYPEFELTTKQKTVSIGTGVIIGTVAGALIGIGLVILAIG